MEIFRLIKKFKLANIKSKQLLGNAMMKKRKQNKAFLKISKEEIVKKACSITAKLLIKNLLDSQFSGHSTPLRIRTGSVVFSRCAKEKDTV